MDRLPFARKIRRLNRRQRKKLRVGEFQELVFEVRIQFRRPMNDAPLDAFLDGFIELIESRNLAVGGLGGLLPLMETDGVVSAWGAVRPPRQTGRPYWTGCGNDPRSPAQRPVTLSMAGMVGRMHRESQLSQDTVFVDVNVKTLVPIFAERISQHELAVAGIKWLPHEAS